MRTLRAFAVEIKGSVLGCFEDFVISLGGHHLLQVWSFHH